MLNVVAIPIPWVVNKCESLSSYQPCYCTQLLLLEIPSLLITTKAIVIVFKIPLLSFAPLDKNLVYPHLDRSLFYNHTCLFSFYSFLYIIYNLSFKWIISLHIVSSTVKTENSSSAVVKTYIVDNSWQKLLCLISCELFSHWYRSVNEVRLKFILAFDSCPLP